MKTLLDVSVFTFVLYSVSSQFYDLDDETECATQSKDVFVNNVRHVEVRRPLTMVTEKLICDFKIPEATFKLLKPGFSISMPDIRNTFS